MFHNHNKNNKGVLYTTVQTCITDLYLAVNIYRNNILLHYLRTCTKLVCVYLRRMNLCLVKELGDRAAQGRAYGNLGNTHYLLGNFVEAIKFHRQVRNTRCSPETV